MSAIAGGAVEAVGVLYDRHSSILFPIARRIAKGEAEDVLHDVFVSLPDRAKSYTAARGNVAAWLIIVVRNLALDRVRRRGRHAEIEREVAEPAPPAPSPEATADLSLRSTKLHAALAELTALERETLDAAFYEGLTYSEIAERQGVPLGTVKSRVARAFAELRKVLAERD
jgi:RNA polymerase sigma-70 factor (ECF subfamily)